MPTIWGLQQREKQLGNSTPEDKGYFCKHYKVWSRMWNHAICKLCRHKVKPCSNTTNLHLHITATTPNLNETCNSKYPSTLTQVQHITNASSCFYDAKCIPVICDVWLSYDISPDWEKASYVLKTTAVFDSHIMSNTAHLLWVVLDEWGLVDNNPVLVTDNAIWQSWSSLLKLAQLEFAQCELNMFSVSDLLGNFCGVVPLFFQVKTQQ